MEMKYNIHKPLDKDDLENACPGKMESTLLTIPCPLKDEFNVDHYRILLDGDIEKNNIYIELGYGDDTAYDSGFFLSTYHALELVKHLTDIINKTTTNNILFTKSKNAIEKIKTLFLYDQMKSIEIIPMYPYTRNPEDTMFGCIQIEVIYTDIDDDTTDVYLLSEPYKYKDLMKYETIEKDLVNRNSHLESAKFDNKRFKSIIRELKEINDNCIEELEVSTNNTSPDRQAKIELEDMAKTIIKKMGENNNV